MLQLAMALSLNDQQQVNPPLAEAQPHSSQPLQPPATLPRSIMNTETATSSNSNQTNESVSAEPLRPLSRQNSNEVSGNTTTVKPLSYSKNSKRKPNPSVQNEEENKVAASTSIVTISTEIPNQIPTPQYLLNQSLKLFHLRKTLLVSVFYLHKL